METNMAVCSRFGLLKSIILFFTNKKEVVPRSDSDVSAVINEELNYLWLRFRARNEEGKYDIDLSKEIFEFFCGVSGRSSGEQLDSIHAWPRFVKIAVQSVNEPIAELVCYVNGNNYICLIFI